MRRLSFTQTTVTHSCFGGVQGHISKTEHTPTSLWRFYAAKTLITSAVCSSQCFVLQQHDKQKSDPLRSFRVAWDQSSQLWKACGKNTGSSFKWLSRAGETRPPAQRGAPDSQICLFPHSTAATDEMRHKETTRVRCCIRMWGEKLRRASFLKCATCGSQMETAAVHQTQSHTEWDPNKTGMTCIRTGPFI